MKYNVGDMVIVVNAKGQYAIYNGVEAEIIRLATFNKDKEIYILDTDSLHFDYSPRFYKEEIVLLEVYNSPLYKALL